jgi:hypothetical protein
MSLPAKAPGSPGTKQFENCDQVGAYGYGITHVDNAAVDRWDVMLSTKGESGEKLTQVASATYRLEVPQGTIAAVGTQVTPKIGTCKLGCLCCGQTKSGAAFVFFTSLAVGIVGVLAYRRRR